MTRLVKDSMQLKEKLRTIFVEKKYTNLIFFYSLQDGFCGEFTTKPSQESKSYPSTNIAMVEDAGYLVPNNVTATGQTEPAQSNVRRESGLEVSDMKVNEIRR